MYLTQIWEVHGSNLGRGPAILTGCSWSSTFWKMLRYPTSVSPHISPKWVYVLTPYVHTAPSLCTFSLPLTSLHSLPLTNPPPPTLLYIFSPGLQLNYVSHMSNAKSCNGKVGERCLILTPAVQAVSEVYWLEIFWLSKKKRYQFLETAGCKF
jgi:hypothetical protein